MTKPHSIFIQPRHTYAPKDGLGHIYMPTAILMATSRTLQAGGRVSFWDENIRPVEIPSGVSIVGTHTVGPSLMPSTLELQAKLQESNLNLKFLHGGQIIDGLDRQPLACAQIEGKNFKRLFGERAMIGNNLATLTRELELGSIPPITQTSLIPAYELIDDEDMMLYLSNPFSLYVSQGCKYACNFCSAKRSTNFEGEARAVTEEYRDIEVIQKDVEYLVARARELEVKSLTMYMSNLDLAQSSQDLARFAQMMKEVGKQNADVPITLTGLATVLEYKKLSRDNPEILANLGEAGLSNIGFGVEGMASDYWKTLRKGQNKEADCYDIIEDAVQRGFTPEILLTPGHEKDTQSTLKTTVEYAEFMKEEYGSRVIVRPYCAKSWLPGNDGWYSARYANRVETVIKDPSLFQALEFNAEQTEFTSPNVELLDEVNSTYLRLVELSEGAAPALLAVTPNMGEAERETVRAHNEGKYDH